MSVDVKAVAAKYATGTEAKEKMEADLQGEDTTVDDASWVTASIDDTFVGGLDSAAEAQAVQADLQVLVDHAKAGPKNGLLQQLQEAKGATVPPQELLGGVLEKVKARVEALQVAEAALLGYGLKPVDDGSFASDFYDLALAVQLALGQPIRDEYHLEPLLGEIDRLASHTPPGSLEEVEAALKALPHLVKLVSDQIPNHSTWPINSQLEMVVGGLDGYETTLREEVKTLARQEYESLTATYAKAMAALGDDIFARQALKPDEEPKKVSFPPDPKVPDAFVEVHGIGGMLPLEPASTMYLQVEGSAQYYEVEADPELLKYAVVAYRARSQFAFDHPYVE